MSRAFPAPFAGQFQDKVAAHGKPNQGKTREFFPGDQGARDFANVVRPSGMIKRGRETICPATVALVHTDYVHPRGQALRRNADGIAGIAGAIQTVYNGGRQGLRTIWLPMALAHDLHSGLDFDEPLVGRREVKPA